MKDQILVINLTRVWYIQSKTFPMKIDKYKRYQNGLSVEFMFPKKNDGKCDCGCKKKLEGRRRRWANDECRLKSYILFAIIKGDSQIIRSHIVKRERENTGGLYCKECGQDLQLLLENWHADHIIEVRNGGGGCSLENFQPLCIECHKSKTKSNFKT